MSGHFSISVSRGTSPEACLAPNGAAAATRWLDLVAQVHVRAPRGDKSNANDRHAAARPHRQQSHDGSRVHWWSLPLQDEQRLVVVLGSAGGELGDRGEQPVSY